MAQAAHSTHPARRKKTELFQGLEKWSEIFPTLGNPRTSPPKLFPILGKQKSPARGAGLADEVMELD